MMELTSFPSEDERKVFYELTKIYPKLGKIYYSGLVVLRQKTPTQTEISINSFLENISNDEDLKNCSNSHHKNDIEDNPDRIAQSAHSMRETTNVLKRYLKINSSTSESTTKIIIQKLSDPQLKLPTYLQLPFDQFIVLHKLFTNISHHGSDISEQEYFIKVKKFTVLLLHILTSHYEVIHEIDELLKKSNPNKNDLKKIAFLMSKDTQTYIHFFTNAKDNWLNLLYQDGKYFKETPKAIKTENLSEFPFYPEAYYLERVASKQPEMVQKIILKIQIYKDDNSKKNSTVLRNFIGAALQMPSEFGKEIAKKAIKEKWHIDTVNLEKDLVDLMIKLAEKEFDTSLDLCKSLLDVTITEPLNQKILNEINISLSEKLQSVIPVYSYVEILTEKLSILLDKDHDAVLCLLVDKLVKADKLASKAYEESKNIPIKIIHLSGDLLLWSINKIIIQTYVLI